jgi:hypothetical protein
VSPLFGKGRATRGERVSLGSGSQGRPRDFKKVEVRLAAMKEP